MLHSSALSPHARACHLDMTLGAPPSVSLVTSHKVDTLKSPKCLKPTLKKIYIYIYLFGTQVRDMSQGYVMFLLGSYFLESTGVMSKRYVVFLLGSNFLESTGVMFLDCMHKKTCMYLSDAQ